MAKNQPAVNQPAPVVNQPAPVVNQPAPVVTAKRRLVQSSLEGMRGASGPSRGGKARLRDGGDLASPLLNCVAFQLKGRGVYPPVKREGYLLSWGSDLSPFTFEREELRGSSIFLFTKYDSRFFALGLNLIEADKVSANDIFRLSANWRTKQDNNFMQKCVSSKAAPYRAMGGNSITQWIRHYCAVGFILLLNTRTKEEKAAAPAAWLEQHIKPFLEPPPLE